MRPSRERIRARRGTVVRRVSGTVLWGAYYYTGIETGHPPNGSGQAALTSFLDNLEMLPGYFVRVRIPRPVEETALLVPDTALGSDQGGRFVLTVNNDNVVEQRKVETGPLVGTLRVIDKTPPKVTSTTPAKNAPGVAAEANVKATFSEAMQDSTINATTFNLKESGTSTNLSATVTYDPIAHSAVLRRP